MRVTIFFMILTVITPLVAVTTPSLLKIPASRDQVRLENDSHLIDLVSIPWEYCVDDQDRSAEEIAAVTQWETIDIGRRWEAIGRQELNNKTVWLRIDFSVEEDISQYKIGFFCTAFDDHAEFYLNGNLALKSQYIWGHRIPGPTNIDLTKLVKFGGKNRLLIKLSDEKIDRAIGLLGNVCLYKSLPFERTPENGIAVDAAYNDLAVILHLGSALMAKGDNTVFSAQALENLVLPPYILRDDELIIIAPANTVKDAKDLFTVELNNVTPTSTSEKLTVNNSPIPESVGLYELMQIPLTVSAKYDNPFDSEQVNVQALVATPSGDVEKVPAFFEQDFTRHSLNENEEILLPRKSNPWKLYYRPRQLGQHTITIFAQDASGMEKTSKAAFNVVPSGKKGLLHVSKNDPRFFEYDNGESYYGIGPSGWFRGPNFLFGGNSRWVNTSRDDYWYKKKGSAGSSFDYCLSAFFGQLYLKDGFIDQHVAYKLEHRVRLMEKYDVHWAVVYDDIRRSFRYGLESMPYAVEQNGPCRQMPELYFNEKALNMQKAQIRYFVSRLSDSPAIWLWNCGDESQPGQGYSRELILSWLKELHAYIRNIDVYKHPHAIGEEYGSIRLGGDCIIIHDWSPSRIRRGRKGDMFYCDCFWEDEVALNCCFMAEYSTLNKPIIIPEGGEGDSTKWGYISGIGWDFDEATSFHNDLWISLFLKSAAGGTHWLPNVIDAYDQLYHAKAIANYIKGENLTADPYSMVPCTVSDDGVRAFALQNQSQTLVWVQNVESTWFNMREKQAPPIVADAEAFVSVSNAGLYRVEYWDTRSGVVLETKTIDSIGLRVVCPLPEIQTDIALKVILN